MTQVLVVNSGSSSFKYRLIDAASGETLADGLVERIGEPLGRSVHTDRTIEEPSTTVSEQPIPDHSAGFALMTEAFGECGPVLDPAQLIGVGHRVVQGGQRFVQPTLVTDEVIADVTALSELAPLHNPGAIQGIQAARAVFPTVPSVAVFDTAFHQTMPEYAARYAIDAEVAEEYGIRRYGFHGTSHEFVAQTAARHLGIPLNEFSAVSLHLGNGASACAIRNGISIDTSMGMTPLAGLVMGTRSGDIDPAVLPYLARQAGMSPIEIDRLLNTRSGMLGVTGSSDLRDVTERAVAGDERAALGLAMMTHRLKFYIGGYLAELGRADAIIFTAGVGENSPTIRAAALAGLEGFGIELDPAANERREAGIRTISTPQSTIAVLVVPTNEERAIAEQVARLLVPLA